MDRQQVKTKFQKKVLALLLVSTLLPLVIGGGLVLKNTIEIYQGFFERQLHEAASHVRVQSERWYDSKISLLTFLIREVGTHPKNDWQVILQNVVLSEPNVYVAHLTDRTGQNIGRSDDRPFNHYEDREWFQKALSGEFSSEPLMARVYKRPSICTAGPVYQNGRVAYIANICSFIESLSKSIGAIRIGQTGFAILIDEKGRILAHPSMELLSPAKSEEERALIERAMLAEENERFEIVTKDVPVVAFVSPLPNGWRAVAFQSQAEIASLSWNQVQWPMAIGLATLLSFLILTYFFVEHLTTPLQRLAEAVRRFGRGDLEARAYVESTDEVGLMARNFNLMATQIRATIEELKNKELLLAKHRDELHQKVIEQSQKLLYAAKMSSLGEMAGGIAHEVNNPLAIISLKAQRLQQGLQDGRLAAKDGIELAEQIEQTCLRINRIIRGLKTFSRDGSRDPMIKENLSSILTETESLCHESLRAKGIQLDIICPEIYLECQPIQLSQVFLNLIMNAQSAVSTLNQRWIEIKVTLEGERVVIRITDSGLGIPEPVRSQMMQPFYTTKGVGEGTGLGLSICKGIIEHHHGMLTYNSDSEHTQFLISMPLVQKSNRVAPTKNRPLEL